MYPGVMADESPLQDRIAAARMAAMAALDEAYAALNEHGRLAAACIAVLATGEARPDPEPARARLAAAVKRVDETQAALRALLDPQPPPPAP